MKISILPVPPAALIARWREVEPLLDTAMPVNLRRYESIDILDMCIRNMAQGWFVFDDDELIAVVISQINQYPRRRALTVFCLAGVAHRKMSEWFGKADAVLTDYAAQMRCDHFECQGRPGWEKVLDLKPRSTFFVKDLTVNNEMNAGGAHA